VFTLPKPRVRLKEIVCGGPGRAGAARTSAQASCTKDFVPEQSVVICEVRPLDAFWRVPIFVIDAITAGFPNTAGTRTNELHGKAGSIIVSVYFDSGLFDLFRIGSAVCFGHPWATPACGGLARGYFLAALRAATYCAPRSPHAPAAADCVGGSLCKRPFGWLRLV
jgi:hypothetical protein